MIVVSRTLDRAGSTAETDRRCRQDWVLRQVVKSPDGMTIAVRVTCPSAGVRPDKKDGTMLAIE
jgi:hypothetical protein